MSKDKVLKQISILEAWFEENNYKGYDPYDLFDTKLFHSLIDIKYKLLRKVNRRLISWFVFLFPELVIKLFNKKPNINAKAMGLLLKAKCNMYELTNDEKYLNSAKEIAKWLLDNRSQGLKGYGWGYPFDWSGSVFIPKNTASSVVSTVVGDGLYSLYSITNDDKYIEACNNICVFLSEDLNIDYVNNNEICFSYTPIDKNHVINANLFAAEFLIRIGQQTNKNKYIELGKKAINYTLKQQQPSGDFLYWGVENKEKLKFSNSNSDHYHTGFELRMLYRIWKYLKEDNIKRSIDRYYDFYVANYINTDNSINMFPNKKYPINIHSCAEVLNCNALLSEQYKDEKVDINKIFYWIQSEMLNDDNLYIYEIRDSIFGELKNAFLFNRWSQAWMLLALTEYYKKISNNE